MGQSLCCCDRLGVSDVRDAVFRFEKAYLDLMKRRKATDSYRDLVLRLKHSWGLCPYCDMELRRMVETGSVEHYADHDREDDFDRGPSSVSRKRRRRETAHSSDAGSLEESSPALLVDHAR